MEYTIEYFIAKFEAIPEKDWTTKDYVNEGKSCALGHCGVREHLDTGWPVTTDEGEELNELLCAKVPEINDGEDTRYQQATPKERILAALRDVQKML